MLNFVVALVAESQPLIRHFGLKEDLDARGFRLYRGDDIRLVISGIGKTAASAGTAYLAAVAGAGHNDAWLNVGIAGHAALTVGEGVHALRIIDAATGRNWCPPQILKLPGRGLSVLTVDQAEMDYAGDAVYEMEAAAFYSTALRFSVGEMTQCYKIISDNRADPANKITRQRIGELVDSHLPVIEEAVDALGRLAADLADTLPQLNDFNHFVDRWHFTVSQEHQLRSLMQQWAARAPDKPLWNEGLNRCPSAKSVLAELRQMLGKLTVDLDES